MAAEPAGRLDPEFSGPDASATPWAEASRELEVAEIYWLSTVRPDGRPHVTPLIGVWLENALYFCTGAEERKAKNLEGQPQCVITTGCNKVDDGLDLVVEGEATRTSDDAKLIRAAEAYAAKYRDPMWHFTARDGAFYSSDGNRAVVYEMTPSTVYAFSKGRFGQTRWRF
ncbi:MAG: hypothetical protein QOI81_2168 [Actinomycetota bacterium]|nr:hypothetical protein [Actinomycetota bacterium]